MHHSFSRWEIVIVAFCRLWKGRENPWGVVRKKAAKSKNHSANFFRTSYSRKMSLKLKITYIYYRCVDNQILWWFWKLLSCLTPYKGRAPKRPIASWRDLSFKVDFFWEKHIRLGFRSKPKWIFLSDKNHFQKKTPFYGTIARRLLQSFLS